MKIVEVATRYGLDIKKFNEFLCTTVPEGFSLGLLENKFEKNADLNAIVSAFKKFEVHTNEDTARLSNDNVGTEEVNINDAIVQTKSIAASDVDYLSKIDSTLLKIERHVRFLRNVVIVYLVIFGLMLFFAFFSSIIATIQNAFF